MIITYWRNRTNLESKSSSIWRSTVIVSPLARVPASASLFMPSPFLWNSCSGYSKNHLSQEKKKVIAKYNFKRIFFSKTQIRNGWQNILIEKREPEKRRNRSQILKSKRMKIKGYDIAEKNKCTATTVGMNNLNMIRWKTNLNTSKGYSPCHHPTWCSFMLLQNNNRRNHAEPFYKGNINVEEWKWPQKCIHLFIARYA